MAMKAVVRQDELEDLVGTVGPDVPRPDGPLRPLPRPQVRPGRAEGLLPPGRRPGRRAPRRAHCTSLPAGISGQRRQFAGTELRPMLQTWRSWRPGPQTHPGRDRQGVAGRRAPRPASGARGTSPTAWRTRAVALHGKPHGDADARPDGLVLDGKDRLRCTAAAGEGPAAARRWKRGCGWTTWSSAAAGVISVQTPTARLRRHRLRRAGAGALDGRQRFFRRTRSFRRAVGRPHDGAGPPRARLRAATAPSPATATAALRQAVSASRPGRRSRRARPRSSSACGTARPGRQRMLAGTILRGQPVRPRL